LIHFYKRLYLGINEVVSTCPIIMMTMLLFQSDIF